MLALEADRMGLRVSDEEHADLLKKLVPTAFTGDTFIGMDRYTAEVQARFQMSVPEFETEVKNALLQQKFQQLVTDGVTASDDEVREEFRRENEKIKLDYVVIKPEDLQSKVEVSDADLAAYFDKNKAQYVVPERRTVDYAVLSLAQLRQRTPVTEDDEKVYYQSHIDQYKLEDRAHVAHILFKTVGMTDAEAAEVKKKAEDVLNKAKHGGNFADLAKQYSEDTTKDKGGDLGWIVRGQTVPEFEAAAFSLPKGSISDLVKTQYGFHIIQVIDRETARTQTLDEVKASIVNQLQQEKAEQLGETVSTQIADEIRRGGRVPIEDLAKKFNMTTGEAKLVEANQPLPELGNAPGLMDNIFHQRVGDVGAPIHTDLGYVVTFREGHSADASRDARGGSRPRGQRLPARKSSGPRKIPRRRTRQARQSRRKFRRCRQSPRSGRKNVGTRSLEQARSPTSAAPSNLPLRLLCRSARPAIRSRSGRTGPSIASRSTIPSTRTISTSRKPKSKSKFCSASGKPPTICSEHALKARLQQRASCTSTPRI